MLAREGFTQNSLCTRDRFQPKLTSHELERCPKLTLRELEGFTLNSPHRAHETGFQSPNDQHPLILHACKAGFTLKLTSRACETGFSLKLTSHELETGFTLKTHLACMPKTPRVRETGFRDRFPKTHLTCTLETGFTIQTHLACSYETGFTIQTHLACTRDRFTIQTHLHMHTRQVYHSNSPHVHARQVYH